MRLRLLIDALTRRAFNQRVAGGVLGGKGLLQMLLGFGVDAATTASLVKAPRLFASMAICDTSGWHNRDAEMELNDFYAGIRALRRLSQSRDLAVAADDGALLGVTEISQDRLAKLVASATGVVDRQLAIHGNAEPKTFLMLQFGDIKLYVGDQPLSPLPDRPYSALVAPIAQWWDLTGKWAPYALNDKLYSSLVGYGIDPRVRPPVAFENLAEAFLYHPDEFGDPRRYGLTPEMIRNVARAWDENDLRHALAGFEEVETIKPRPDDEIWGSSMHQPMEAVQRLVAFIVNH